MKPIIFLFLSLLLALPAWSQMSQQQRDSVNNLTEADHQLMLQLLGVDALRAGPSGNPEAPNAANSDESKVRYENVPDPLTFDGGKPVKNAKDWKKRRAELFELFDREMYGRTPKNLPSVKWELVWEKDTLIGSTETTYKKMKGIVDNSGFSSISVAIDFE